MLTDFEIIWQRIIENEGETFFTITDIPFTYAVANNSVIPGTNRKIPKSNFANAISLFPISKPSDLPRKTQGASYVFGILNDTRITG